MPSRTSRRLRQHHRSRDLYSLHAGALHVREGLAGLLNLYSRILSGHRRQDGLRSLRERRAFGHRGQGLHEVWPWDDDRIRRKRIKQQLSMPCGGILRGYLPELRVQDLPRGHDLPVRVERGAAFRLSLSTSCFRPHDACDTTVGPV